MAKKALVSTVEPRGENDSGYRVIEVVEASNTFETHSSLEWKDCPDYIEVDLYWWDPSISQFRKLPEAVSQSTAGELTMDDSVDPPVPTEDYVWDWTTETWSKVQIL